MDRKTDININDTMFNIENLTFLKIPYIETSILRIMIPTIKTSNQNGIVVNPLKKILSSTYSIIIL
jgi:hypothetical protein